MHADGDVYNFTFILDTLEIGFQINQMDMGSIIIWMGQPIRDHGVKINKMVMEWKPGQMELNMMEIIVMARNKERGNSSGQTTQSIQFKYQRYEGDFAENNIHGRGVYEWADGRKVCIYTMLIV